MHTIKSLTLKISAIIILTLSTNTISNAQEIETSNFSGTINTTISSGLTVRTERNCENLDGYSYSGPVGTYVDGSGAGCARALTDAYNNTTTKQLSRSSGTGDDGSMNFDQGDVVTATQKFYSEILGSFSNGIGLNLSFSGFVDPATSINTPTYAPFTTKSANEFERGFDLLNAYVYGSSEIDDTYVDWTIGRQVTNWGEATFIPIGMNGFTTNALDLTKLRGPGSTIREALIPTNQLTMSTPLEGGINLEAFIQFEHRAINLDPAGSFYGNEIVGSGSTKMITNGMYNRENKFADDCNYMKVGNNYDDCNAATIAEANTTAGDQTYGTTYLLTKGLQAVSAAEAAAGEDFAQAKVWGSGNLANADGAKWTDIYTTHLNGILGSATASGAAASGNAVAAGGVDRTFFTTNTVGFNLATTAGASIINSSTVDADGTQTSTALRAIDADVSAESINTFATVSIRRNDTFIKEARDDGQFGVRLSGFSDLGDGFDWSLNYSRFHSKTPYVRVNGQGGIYAGDLYGIISHAGDTAVGSRSQSQNDIVAAITNGAYGSGVCGAVFGDALANATFNAADSTGNFWNATQAAFVNYDGSLGRYVGASTQQKNLSDQFNYSELIPGYGLVHNAAKCWNTAESFTAANSQAFAVGNSDVATNLHTALYNTSEVLVAAITPLNLAKYELIYPEDLDAIGFSFNTNIAGTAVQGELTYRPDFPLSHNVGDQVAQIGDVSGAFDVLDMFAFNTVANRIINNSNDNSTPVSTIVTGHAISPNFYNATTTGMTATEIFQQGARMQMIGLATYSAGQFTLTANNDFTLPGDDNAVGIYRKWVASTHSQTASYLGLANVKKGIFDAGYVQACTPTFGATVCGSHTLGAGSYNSAFYTGAAAAVAVAYEAGTVAFNRSTLPALLKANTVSNYNSTPFVKKDVWSYDVATTTTFSASHPITSMLGADSVAFLSEVGAVAIAGMDNATDGYIARNGFQEGIGQEKCHGPFGALVAGGTSFGGAAGGLTHLGAGQVDALFGNGGYCEDQNGADSFATSYRLIGTATYNNFNNSGWSLSPTVVWAHDPYGYGPASLGGFVEDKMTMSLSLSAKKGAAINIGLNYTAHLEGPEVSATSDRDTLTASMSYSF
tara:strand:- start:294 stop:3680 length:3387 start_codon:yes stop_codon:yes gene_type:complete